MENDELREMIIGSCFDVMNELGAGFLEAVYKNALFITLKEKGLKVEVEKRYEVLFKNRKVGLYIADMVVEDKVLVELKCCELLHGDHLALVINYLKVSGVPKGLLVNFGNKSVKYKKLHHPNHPSEE